jgi:hypothetical protein
MVIEGDDQRVCSARLGLRDEVPEQVGVSPVETIEDADHDEPGPVLPSQLIDAVDDLHRGSDQVAGEGAAPLGVTNTFSGANRPADALAIATSAPPGACRR